jgi:uncharacterized repeat protein (TIGR01451 family)
MRSLKQTTTTRRRRSFKSDPTRKFFLSCILTILAAVSGVGTAVAQVTPTASNTTLVAGLTLPFGAQILTGTALSNVTGKPVRHLWTGDAGGFCRIDGEIDGPGPFNINTSTCITTVGGVAFSPGRMVFDPLTNNIYSVNNSAPSNVARFHFLPDGDSGQGLVSATAEFLGDAGGCGLAGNFPWVISFGPDANLYLGFKKTGNLVRVITPQAQTVPCSNVQVFGTTHDTRIGKGLGWIGHDLWGADIVGIWQIANADQCFTPANNFTQCKGVILLHTLVPNPFEAITDQVYPATDGNNLFAFTPTGTSLIRVSGMATTAPTFDLNYALNLGAGISMIADTIDPVNPVLYVSVDPGLDGGTVGTGSIEKVSINANATPQGPGVPLLVSAAAGNTQVTVSWLPGGGGAATSYTVRTIAANGSVVPDVTVNAPTTLTVITGLTNGVSYTFEVSASNAVGSSSFSSASNPVTPLVLSVPGAPTAVTAVAADSQATVFWTPPANNGNATITSYTVTARINSLITGITANTNGNSTSAVLAGLANGTTYTFTVHAINSQGAGPESAPSNPVTPTRTLGSTDMALSMTGPISINSGGNATYSITISNLGPNFAPQVTVNDFVPVGATFVSGTPSQGACSLLGSQFQCNLGGMVVGGSATFTLVLNVTSAITNTATVSANDASGNPLTDPSPVNNTANFSTLIAPPPTTTDLQVTGSPLNGGPTAGPTTTDTITWQIKNAQNAPANSVVFTASLPPGLPFSSLSTSTGSCTAPPPGSGEAIKCNADTIAAGQTVIVVINFTVPAAGSFSSTGHASFSGNDTNTANNTFTVTINAK